ncbi:FunZ [Clostridium sp. 19966]|uniref:P-loop ATPase, Sll1717 family n=1 Tax=Clostridium sp. 19966 TaxID=2768166 RepID=UPI0028E04BF9|nr:hypothetical protein [Clostridium sp. 19966]MDT8718876.1 FunZ [Clostridium sp. 19966]
MYDKEKVKLNHIFIGYADGELEAERLDFENIFYKDEDKYNQIVNDPHKFILSGKKGTGKTILSKYIEKVEGQKGALCKIIKLQDFNLQRLMELGYRNFEDYELTVFFKWTMFYEICKLIIANRSSILNYSNISSYEKFKHFIKYSNNIKKIKSIFKIRYPSGNYSKVNFTTSNGLKVSNDLNNKISDFLNIKSSMEDSRSITSVYQKKDYYQILQEIEQLIIPCLKYTRVIIIYDDLDQIDNSILDNKFYNRLLIALLEAAKDINHEFCASNSKGCKIITLIRSDILSALQMNSSNLNKLTTDSEVKLYWIDKYFTVPENHSLMNLVLTKIQNSVPEYSSLNKHDLYSLLFPDSIDGKTVINYLLDYSFGRPRDIIAYLNIIINEYPNCTFFGANLFKKCNAKYSKWFYTELLNELSNHHDCSYTKDSLNLISDLGHQTFDFSLLEKYFNQNVKQYPNINDLKECINFLYNFGVLGNSWRTFSSVPSKKYRYSWSYIDDDYSSANFNKKFIVHYGLKKIFSL